MKSNRAKLNYYLGQLDALNKVIDNMQLSKDSSTEFFNHFVGVQNMKIAAGQQYSKYLLDCQQEAKKLYQNKKK